MVCNSTIFDSSLYWFRFSSSEELLHVPLHQAIEAVEQSKVCKGQLVATGYAVIDKYNVIQSVQ